MEPETSVARTVVERVAAAEGVDATELPPLGRIVDTDALDSLFAADAGRGHVSFEYHGYDVTVYQDDAVEIQDSSTVHP